jgi:hypothetical protein
MKQGIVNEMLQKRKVVAAHFSKTPMDHDFVWIRLTMNPAPKVTHLFQVSFRRPARDAGLGGR